MNMGIASRGSHFLFQRHEGKVLVFQVVEEEAPSSDSSTGVKLANLTRPWKAAVQAMSDGSASGSSSEELSDKEVKPREAMVLVNKEQKKLLHQEGRCQPCRYFRFREDGCRQGDQCPFCHECTAEESLQGQKWLKHRRQREKRRQNRLTGAWQ
ncbi:C3H1-type domain-containing protein [Durusdinium trenchii]|uniref:C3H1-type domain-containing protein n=1 Tax=Durusdinium trenchii TaxID=1381693 RepID=A0ABP0RT26_9DINO